VKVLIADIKIGNRLRVASGNIGELAESFKKFGQLQPIVLTSENELVAGFRRLSAAKVAGWTDIEVVYREQMTKAEQREIELEENIRRLDMTWLEKANAIAEIDRLKREQNPNWSRDMTAAVAGTNRAADVSDAVKITKLVELFPELKDAKSLAQAQSWALAKVASVVRVKEVKDNPAEFAEIEEKILLGDSVKVIKSLPAGLFRAIITDPPFGISYDKRKAGTEQSITSYEDSQESYDRILGMASDFYRVIKDDGWLTFFLGPTHYERAKGIFRAAGFTVDEMPVVWDRSDGHCYTARPDRYYARGYDLALHCLKGNPEMSLYGRGKHNVLRFEPVPGDERELLVERPVELYQEIIKRLTVEGETIADFFVGSGSVLAAAALLKRNYFGVELDTARRAAAIKKVRAYTPDE